MGHTKGEPCSCGFPQSYPIPHEHDRTARENQIIAHYEDSNKAMYEALIVVKRDGLTNNTRHFIDKALAKGREV